MLISGIYGTAQIEGVRVIGIRRLNRWAEEATGKAERFKPRKTAPFCFIGIHWESYVVTPSRMGNMVGATS
jgi:hypothetical protein